MNPDPIQEFKQRQRAMWASFGPAALFTTPVAGHLVRLAGVAAHETVLDIGTGTGVVAITAALRGATVSAIDLSTELLAQAQDNATLARVPAIAWMQGDAEALPYPEASFDVVLSQFGHMFAPRPAVVVAELRRVLKPGGRLVFATWPPEHFVGRMFALVGRHAPPPPPGVAPPAQWGDPRIIAERLGASFGPPFHERGVMQLPALSVTHFRTFMERVIGPLQSLVQSLSVDPPALAQLRAELEALAAPYHFDNLMHQDYLLTRAAVA